MGDADHLGCFDLDHRGGVVGLQAEAVFLGGVVDVRIEGFGFVVDLGGICYNVVTNEVLALGM